MNSLRLEHKHFREETRDNGRRRGVSLVDEEFFLLQLNASPQTDFVSVRLKGTLIRVICRIDNQIPENDDLCCPR